MIELTAERRHAALGTLVAAAAAGFLACAGGHACAQGCALRLDGPAGAAGASLALAGLAALWALARTAPGLRLACAARPRPPC